MSRSAWRSIIASSLFLIHPLGEWAKQIFGMQLRPEAADGIEIDDDFRSRSCLWHQRANRSGKIRSVLQHTKAKHPVEPSIRKGQVIDACL